MKNRADDLRAEYPPELIRSGERGKYVERYREGSEIVLIEPELQPSPDDVPMTSERRRRKQGSSGSTR